MNYDPFTIGPSIFDSLQCVLGSQSQTAVLTGSGDTPTSPAWATLAGLNSDKTVIDTTDYTLAGEYDFTITYTIDPDS